MVDLTPLGLINASNSNIMFRGNISLLLPQYIDSHFLWSLCWIRMLLLLKLSSKVLKASIIWVLSEHDHVDEWRHISNPDSFKLLTHWKYSSFSRVSPLTESYSLEGSPSLVQIDFVVKIPFFFRKSYMIGAFIVGWPARCYVCGMDNSARNQSTWCALWYC